MGQFSMCWFCDLKVRSLIAFTIPMLIGPFFGLHLLTYAKSQVITSRRKKTKTQLTSPSIADKRKMLKMASANEVIEVTSLPVFCSDTGRKCTHGSRRQRRGESKSQRPTAAGGLSHLSATQTDHAGKAESLVLVC